MRVLALDTTTREGSVALVDDDRIVEERGGDPLRSHAERLPADLLRLVAETGEPLTSVDRFAVAAGPGSFTGLRIGIATVQGLAVVTRRPVTPVSVLDALAQAASNGWPPGTLVGVWMDAHRHEVFSSLYRMDHGALFARDRLTVLDPPAAGDPLVTWARWRATFGLPPVVIGDGAMMYADVLGSTAQALTPPRLAGIIGRMASGDARPEAAADPAGLQPLYVRRPDAEIARENSPPRRTPGTRM